MTTQPRTRYLSIAEDWGRAALGHIDAAQDAALSPLNVGVHLIRARVCAQLACHYAALALDQPQERAS